MVRVVRSAALAGALLGFTGSAQAQDPQPLTASEFWRLVLQHEQAERPGGLELLTDLVRRHADAGHHVTVWRSIDGGLREAEGRDDAAIAATHLATLRFLADAIAAALGDRARQAHIANYAGLDQAQRRSLRNGERNFRSAEGGRKAVSPDWPSLVRRYRACLDVFDGLHDPWLTASALERVGEAEARVGRFPESYTAWKRARELAGRLNDREAVDRVDVELAALERRAADGRITIRRSPLSDSTSLARRKDGAAAWETVALTRGKSLSKLPAATPLHPLRDNPWFWRRLTLEDGRAWQTGGPPGGWRLAMAPGAVLQKTPGKRAMRVVYAGGRAQVVKAGARPALYKLQARFSRDGRSQPYSYPVQLATPDGYTAWGQRRSVSRSDRHLDVRVRPTAARSGTLSSGVRVTIVDANFNGAFGARWQAGGDIGGDEGDAVITGRRGGFFSPLLRVGGGYWYCRPDRSTLSMRCVPYAGPTATLRIRLHGLKGRLAWCVLEQNFRFPGAEEGTPVRALVDVSDAATRPVTLPAGRWRLHYAELVDARRGAAGSWVEIRNGGRAPLDLAPDAVAEFVVGGRLTPVVEAVWASSTRTASLQTGTLVVHGERGERYEAAWPAPLAYTYTIHDARGRTLAKDRTTTWAPADLIPAGSWLEVLGFAKPASHQVKGPVEPPLTVAVKGRHPLLGPFARARTDPVPGAVERDDVLTGDGETTRRAPSPRSR